MPSKINFSEQNTRIDKAADIISWENRSVFLYFGFILPSSYLRLGRSLSSLRRLPARKGLRRLKLSDGLVSYRISINTNADDFSTWMSRPKTFLLTKKIDKVIINVIIHKRCNTNNPSKLDWKSAFGSFKVCLRCIWFKNYLLILKSIESKHPLRCFDSQYFFLALELTRS